MDSDIALWGLCFLITAIACVVMGLYGLALFALFILATGLLISGN